MLSGSLVFVEFEFARLREVLEAAYFKRRMSDLREQPQCTYTLLLTFG